MATSWSAVADLSVFYVTGCVGKRPVLGEWGDRKSGRHSLRTQFTRQQRKSVLIFFIHSILSYGCLTGLGSCCAGIVSILFPSLEEGRGIRAPPTKYDDNSRERTGKFQYALLALSLHSCFEIMILSERRSGLFLIFDSVRSRIFFRHRRRRTIIAVIIFLIICHSVLCIFLDSIKSCYIL